VGCHQAVPSEQAAWPMPCTRLLSYAVPVDPEARAYYEAMRAYPLAAEWYDAAAREQRAWRQEGYERMA